MHLTTTGHPICALKQVSCALNCSLDEQRIYRAKSSTYLFIQPHIWSTCYVLGYMLGSIRY